MLKKKILANFQRIVEVINMLSNTWVWDPGVKKAPDNGSGNATLTVRIRYLIYLTGPQRTVLFSKITHCFSSPETFVKKEVCKYRN